MRMAAKLAPPEIPIAHLVPENFCRYAHAVDPIGNQVMRENEHRVMAAPPAVPVPRNNEGRAKQQCLDEQFPSGAASLADELPLHSVNRRMFELSQIGRQNLVHPIRYFFWCLCGVSGPQALGGLYKEIVCDQICFQC